MKGRFSLLAVVLTIVMSACSPTPSVLPGSTDGQGATPSVPPGTAGGQGATPQISPSQTAAGAVRQLRIAEAWPAHIDPAIGAAMFDQTVLVNVYDTLVFPTVDGNIVGWVADSWDISSDNLTYTFHLKHGIKFHDGSELKASDVVFSMNRLLKIGQGHAYLFTDRVASSRAIDDYTVEFKIKNPYALFPQTLLRLFIASEKQVTANATKTGNYGEFGDYGTGYLLTHDAGSGPYRVTDVQLEEYVQLEKNADWWAKDKSVATAPDQVRFIPVPPAATLRTLLANRELEISDQWQSSDTLRSVDKIAGVDIAAFNAFNRLSLYLNTKRAPFDDINFRRAVTYAFDYDAAAALDWPGTPIARGPVPAGLAGFNQNMQAYHRDLVKARAALAKSQYASSLGQHPIQFYWITEVPDEEKIALLFQSNMADLGIKVEVVGTPWLQFTDRVSKPDTAPHVVPVYMNADLPEAGSFLYMRYDSNSAGTFMQGEWLQDKTFDAKIVDALGTIDQAKRFQLYGELQTYISDLAPTIFAYDQLEKHAYQTYLDWPAAKGIVYPVMGYNEFAPFIGINQP
jgi:peptide/nickel transport system substrate-binding protein